MNMSQKDFEIENNKEGGITLQVNKGIRMIGYAWYRSELIDICGVYQAEQVESNPSELKAARSKLMKLLSQITKLVFKHVEVIKTGAFDFFKNLEHCVLPDTLEEIESNVFRKCPKLLEKGTLKFPITNLRKMWQDPIANQHRVFMYTGDECMTREHFHGKVKEHWIPLSPDVPNEQEEDVGIKDNTLEIEHGEIKLSDYTRLVEDINYWSIEECFRDLNRFIRHYTVMMPFGDDTLEVKITKRPKWFYPKTYDTEDDILEIYTVACFTALPAEITVLDAQSVGVGASFTVKYHRYEYESRKSARADYKITGWGNSTEQKMKDIIMSQVVWPWPARVNKKITSIYQMVVDEDYVDYVDGNYEDEKEFVDIKDFTCHKFLAMVMSRKINITKEFYIETEYV